MIEHELAGELDSFLADHQPELVEFRRDLHAHPEVAYSEHRTTRSIALRLARAGLRPKILPKGTGVLVDIGSDTDEPPVVALRADIDALPIDDDKPVSYRSVNPGACHACGHDVHATILLGTGLFLARAAASGALPGKVRLIFQPAEEIAGGALDVLAVGGISSVDRIFALHCDPRLDVGKIGTRIGPITAACDTIKVELSGPGGHTARPHLTADMVFALGKIVTELPVALSRRMSPSSGFSLVWGRINAGSVVNAIPEFGVAEGTLRCLDESAWHVAPDIFKQVLENIAGSYGVTPDLSYTRRVPPAVNDESSTEMVVAAVDRVLGPAAIAEAPQSLGGEDFAWYLESIPGSLFRLGTRRPGSGEEFDIHQPMFDVDERCIDVGIKVMAGTAMTALGCGHRAIDHAQEPVTAVVASTEDVTLAGPLLAGSARDRAGRQP